MMTSNPSIHLILERAVKQQTADIAILASSDSRWVTGQLIDASGGSHL